MPCQFHLRRNVLATIEKISFLPSTNFVEAISLFMFAGRLKFVPISPIPHLLPVAIDGLWR